jgi:hypothetical protein
MKKKDEKKSGKYFRKKRKKLEIWIEKKTNKNNEHIPYCNVRAISFKSVKFYAFFI